MGRPSSKREYSDSLEFFLGPCNVGKAIPQMLVCLLFYLPTPVPLDHHLSLSKYAPHSEWSSQKVSGPGIQERNSGPWYLELSLEYVPGLKVGICPWLSVLLPLSHMASSYRWRFGDTHLGIIYVGVTGISSCGSQSLHSTVASFLCRVSFLE